jgi:arylsulfatase A-like enzyme
MANENRRRVSDLVLLGMLFGLFTGLAEFALRLFIAYMLHQPSHHDFGVDLVWMLPASNALVLGCVGIFFGIVSTRWQDDRLLRIAVAVFGAASAYAMLLHFRSLHNIVSIILSVGVGVRLGDILARRPARLNSIGRRLTLPAIGVVALTAFALRATEAVKERRAFASLVAPGTNAPNVLLIVLDAVRASQLSAYGYARRTTPKLERVAQRSVLFQNAIVTAPWSLTSHASMFTGRYPHEMSADWDVPLDATHRTLAEALRDRGYRTAGFVGNNFYGTPEFGLSRGFLHYESRKFSLPSIFASGKLGGAVVRGFNRLTGSYHRPTRMAGSEINRRIFEWLPTSESRPFFIFVNYFDAHEPYVAPPPYNRWFTGTEPPTRRVREGHRNTPAELSGLRDAYDQTLAYLDSQVGALLSELERRNLLANTLLIVTSDHGEEFGEHGWASHGNGLYLPVLHVPLMISFPGRVPDGIVVAEPVTLRDLPATVFDLLGPGGDANFPGHSLASSWAPSTGTGGMPRSPVLSEVSSPGNAPSWYAVARGEMKSIIVGRHHYIRNGDGREELFDIMADAWETTDLANTPQGRAVIVTARAALDSSTRRNVGDQPARSATSNRD